MLTIDDANTIMEKYGESGFYYELDFNKIPDMSNNKEYDYDFCYLKFQNASPSGKDVRVVVQNSLYAHPLYTKKSDGTYALPLDAEFSSSNLNTFHITVPTDGDLILVMYMSKTKITNFNSNIVWYRDNGLILPLSPLQVPVVNGEFNNKFYIDVVGNNITAYTINGSAVTLQTDDNGKYLELPSSNTCIIGTTGHNQSFPLYRVTFKEFKSLPNLSLSTLYKGTSQKVKLYNEDTESYITDFQAYYQGRKLKDNKITLPYDCQDIIDIVVDLKDNNYPFCRLKLKAKTVIYTCSSVQDAQRAINMGISTFKVVGGAWEDMEISNCTILYSNMEVTNCTFNNVTFIGETVTYQGSISHYEGNKYNNCVFKDIQIYSPYDYFCIVKFNNCEITGRYIGKIEAHMAGDCVVDDVELNEGSFIISDGNMVITNCEFWSLNSTHVKEYYPRFLYLTGEYTVKNNSFNFAATYEEPVFNMCIIKTIEGFNPSKFIAENSFNVEINYDSEPTNMLYYNIVDDDKIYARRLS